MKEQNNIEGNVDKTSLKCKGVWIFVFLDFLALKCYNCGTLANHTFPLKTLNQFLSESHQPLFLQTSNVPHRQISLPPSFSYTSIKLTSFSLKWKLFIGSNVSWVSLPLSLQLDFLDQFLCTILAKIKHPAKTQIIHSTETPAGSKKTLA